jgi:hypothetical protein
MARCRKIARVCSFALEEGMHHRNSNARRSQSPRAALIGVIAFFAILAASAIAAEEGEYTPPAGAGYSIQAHFTWCGEGKTVGARIKRYEQFWALQKPEQSDGYDDSLHIRKVRHCAYRLAELYAQAGRAKDCIKMLKWLETDDDSFEVERQG